MVLLAALVAGGTVGRAQTTDEDAGQEEVLPLGENSEGLSLTELEQLALANNPTLVQAGAQVRLSRGKAVQAGLLPNPTVGYVGEQIGADGTAGELHGVFVEQQIVTGGKLQLSRAKYVQEARQAQLQVLAQQYRVLGGVRIAYYEAVARQRRVTLHRQMVANSQEAASTLAELVNVGQASRTDLLQVEVQLQRARADGTRAASRARGAWDELAAMTGIPDLAPTLLTDELDGAGEAALDRDTALANLLMCSPELRFLQAEVARDQIALRRERVEPIPNVQVRAESGYNFETENAVAGVEVGLRLPVFDKNQGTILQAQAELARAQADVARMELVLRRRFAATFAEYESSVTLAESYRTDILPNAQRSYELFRQSFQERRAAWPQVVDAQRVHLELYGEYVDALLGARVAEARLNTFLLDDGLGQPDEPTPEGHRDATPKPR